MAFEEKAKESILKQIDKERKHRGYIKMIFIYLRKHKLFALLIFILALMASSIGVSAPLVMKQIMKCLVDMTDESQSQPTTKFIIWDFTWLHWVLLQIAMYCGLGISIFSLNIAVGKLGKAVEIYLRNETVRALIQQDISYYSDKKIGEILTKLGADTWIIGEQTQNIPMMILIAIFNFIGSSVVLISVDWRLGLISMSFVAFGLSAILIFFSKVKSWIKKLRTTITFVNGDVTDRIGTIRLIKASGTESYEKKRFREIHTEFYETVRAFFKRLSFVLTSAFVSIMAIQLLILTTAYGFYKNDTEKLLIITTSFISGLGTMTSPIFQLLRALFGFLMANECTRRVFQIIDSKPIMDPHFYSGQGKIIDKIDKDIIFENVSFNYPEKPEKNVLPKFNFVFEKGKSYAFVGETGSGKSTISKLLLRFYDPTEGRILINGEVDLKELHLKSYLDLVGYVEQEPQIMFGTVKENIKYTTPNVTDDEVIEAAKKADLHNLIMSWPNKYETILGERGFMLSGGQKQRLVIARMFLKNPQILILDEATSALDNIVEKEIQAELEKLMIGRTSVSIAHRLSTIKNCDHIIVLAPGKGVVQIGTFDELKNTEGHFKKLYDAGLMKTEEVKNLI
ncbi:ABC transporter ATP-binding protein [Spiroplasma apis]|uniref:ABC transporter ATP-binding protein n=1 Tax=Spiroplasma apis B31 TaxID=1276258 RepID=V5RHA0_SPIAP|nr:ABC transporter ATP-binding protein [Spiroplasma apis]AHB35924.1 ABC transporter ATP-binding protein [Spiroplasma apis B31]